MPAANLSVARFATFYPVTASADMAIDELRDLMAKHAVRHLPVVDGRKVVGIISERDVRLVSGLTVAEKLQVRAGDLMSPDPVIVDARTSLQDVAQVMIEKKIGSVIVEDKEDGLFGIFTATDALNALIELIGRLPRSLTS